MADPAAWMLEEETATDRLRTALAEAQAALRRQDAALSKLQGELIASRLEVAGARGEAVRIEGLLRRAEEAAQAFDARGGFAGWDAEVAQLRAVIADLQAETSDLRTGMHLLRTSASWRISAPIRVGGRWLRDIRAAARNLARAIRRRPSPQTVTQMAALPSPALPTRPTLPSPTLPSPGDPNARLVFQARQATAEAESVVTLDALYHLSRSL